LHRGGGAGLHQRTEGWTDRGRGEARDRRGPYAEPAPAPDLRGRVDPSSRARDTADPPRGERLLTALRPLAPGRGEHGRRRRDTPAAVRATNPPRGSRRPRWTLGE